MNDNRLLPPGSQFAAIVDGKPTGLAGCASAAKCDRADTCLRASTRLTPMDLLRGKPVAQCTLHIHTTA